MLRRLVALVVVAAAAAPLAAGHPHPDGCTQPAFTYEWGSGLNFTHRNGDVVPITVEVGNDGVFAATCDVTNATVTLQFPNGDGSSGGRLFTLATGVNFPAGSAPKTFPTKKLTVAFDPGVFRGPVSISVTGVWHTSSPDPDPVTSGSARSVVITRPHVTFTVSPTISLVPPSTAQYDYFAENDSPTDPGMPVNPTPGAYSVQVADDHCSPVVRASGDSGETDVIDPGEIWSYHCERSLPAGSLVDVATFTGSSTRDGRPWPKRKVVTAICGRQFATIVGTEKADTLIGTAGPDVIVGRGGNDVIKGLGGDDIICGGDGADTIRGNGGNDTLRGEAGPDKLIGGTGTDTLLGGPGTDVEHQ
jgi:RTX calcium-binding nonapeptide repeat (4 copies)